MMEKSAKSSLIRITWAFGTDVAKCPKCGGPVSYRDNRPFCRCRLNIHKKSHRGQRKGGRAC